MLRQGSRYMQLQVWQQGVELQWLDIICFPTLRSELRHGRIRLQLIAKEGIRLPSRCLRLEVAAGLEQGYSVVSRIRFQLQRRI